MIQQVGRKIERRAEENGVRFSIVDNAFNSQRCSVCGWTHKANRMEKRFVCGNDADADINAAKNIVLRPSLPAMTAWSVPKGANVKGFFWNPAPKGKGEPSPEAGSLQSPAVQNLTTPVFTRES